MAPSLSQFLLFMRQSVLLQANDRERLLSPLLFSVTVLVLCSLAFGKIEPKFANQIFVAQTYLTSLLAIQISIARIFEPDQQDNAFQIVQSYPISASAWFLARSLTLFLMGISVVVPTMLISALFLEVDFQQVITAQTIITACLAVMGLAPLGILLSAMMMQAGSRQILYPLLFFPLTTPVLLAAVSATAAFIEIEISWASQLESWLGFLIAFDVIYFTLGFLLFAELVEPDH